MASAFVCGRRLASRLAGSFWSNSASSTPYGLEGLPITVREFAKRSRKGPPKRGHGRKQQPQGEVPMLRQSLKKLQFLVHPDRFGAYPEVKEQNQDSLTTLQGFVSSIRQLEGDYPQAGFHDLQFHIMDEHDNMKRVGVTMKTTGGNCKNVVQKSLGELFHQCGIQRDFKWDDGFWEMGKSEDFKYKPAKATDNESEGPIVTPPPSSEAEEEGHSFTSTTPESMMGSYSYPPRADNSEEPGTVQVDGPSEIDPRLERACSGVHKDGVVKMEFSEEDLRRKEEYENAPFSLPDALRHIDPLLEALAAVPWLQEEKPDQCQQLQNEVIERMNSDGWIIKEACHRIWYEDCRNVHELSQGVDGASKIAIASILGHLTKFEKDMGKAPAVERR
mmetsp:Transcript_30828/g.37360  ORF Transcript_30828/g.37360 Transcript_30828/m.37360 type:complete len:389 (-) Transcript_30828:228-1394(-)